MKKTDKYRAEAFDIMQYFYRSVHKPLIHCFIHFTGHIDEIVLKAAVTQSLEAIPQIGCCFDTSTSRPCWRVHGFTGEDIVKVSACQDENQKEQAMKLLSSAIDIKREPQLKIFVVKGQTCDMLSIMINHMICDGAGFKEYLYLLAGLYTKLEQHIKSSMDLAYHTRSEGQLFQNLGFREKTNILFSKVKIPKQEKQIGINLEGDKRNPFFVTCQISKDKFKMIKMYTRSKGVTLNDIVIAAYIRSLSRKTGNDRIILPCPVDLRKYLSEGKPHGICNLTSNYICDITVNKKDTFYDTMMQVSHQMKKQKENKNHLKPIMLLEFVFHIVPFRILQKSFHKLFTIPVVSYTNLGIIDKKSLQFGNTDIMEAFLTGAVKYVPYFQIAISTFDDNCTISCNLHGTTKDKIWIEAFLQEIKKEIESESGID